MQKIIKNTVKNFKITKKPVSLEVFADKSNEMIFQGLEINKWGKNVFVKVPVTNSKSKFMGDVIEKLNSKNIKLNITAVYSANQVKKILRKLIKKQR